MITESGSLLDRINRLIDSDKVSLPVFNQLALRLRQLAQDSNCDVDEVEQLITSDQVLAAEVLRASNSPFYCGLSTIRTIRSAIVRLGMKQVTHLVCLASEHAKYRARDPKLSTMLRELWRHSSSTAMAAQWLANRLRLDSIEDECFLGGLLHDIGQLLILRVIDEIKDEKGQSFEISASLINEVLTIAHCQLGFNLLQRWNIPEVYCRIVQLHHQPEPDATDQTMLVVRMADEASRKFGTGLDPDPTLVLSATPEAQILRTSEVLLAELEIIIEDHINQAV